MGIICPPHRGKGALPHVVSSEDTRMAEPREKEKEIDVKKVVDYLTHAFAAATRGAGRASRMKNEKGVFEPTPAYNYQVDFCYLLDNIQRGPRCLLPKVIADTNDLIKKITEANSK